MQQIKQCFAYLPSARLLHLSLRNKNLNPLLPLHTRTLHPLVEDTKRILQLLLDRPLRVLPHRRRLICLDIAYHLLDPSRYLLAIRIEPSVQILKVVGTAFRNHGDYFQAATFELFYRDFSCGFLVAEADGHGLDGLSRGYTVRVGAQVVEQGHLRLQAYAELHLPHSDAQIILAHDLV